MSDTPATPTNIRRPKALPLETDGDEFIEVLNAPSGPVSPLPSLHLPSAEGSLLNFPTHDGELSALTPSQLYEMNQDLYNESVPTRPLIDVLAPMSELRSEYENGSIAFVKEIDWLISQGYSYALPALGFSYVERLVLLPPSERDFVVASTLSLLDSYPPLLDQAGIDKFVYEDYHELLKDVVAKAGHGLDEAELLEIFQTPENSNAIVLYLRLLTSAQIKANRDNYEGFLVHPDTKELMDVDSFTANIVQAMGKEADNVEIDALSNVLQMNLSVAYLNGVRQDGVDFIPFRNAANRDDQPVVLLYRLPTILIEKVLWLMAKQHNLHLLQTHSLDFMKYVSQISPIRSPHAKLSEQERRQQLFFNLWSQRNVQYRDRVTPETYKRPTLLTSETPRIFALLIGIDRYATLDRLRGAANDVVALHDYLTLQLRVEPERINTLVNGAATRSEILRALRDLKENPTIQRGDPILVHFSGYGGSVEDGSIEEFFVPQDFSEKFKPLVRAIAVRTIETTLEDVAKEKGNNITVTFDCSFKISKTQKYDEKQPDFVRAIRLDPANQERLEKRSIFDGIVIKACSQREEAWETSGQGRFTRAFINLLRTKSPHEIKYSDIPQLLEKIPSQKPQVLGPSGEKTLFDGQAITTHRSCFHASLLSEQVSLHAGAIHGITPGAEFVLYASADTAFQTPLATLPVHSIGPFTSSLPAPANLAAHDSQKTFFAIQTKTGRRDDVRFYVAPNDLLFPCYEALLSLSQSDGGDSAISLVNDPDDAHLEVTVEDGKAVFLIHDKRVLQYDISRLSYEPDPTLDNMMSVFKSAANYYWKLNRAPGETSIADSVSIEFYELKVKEENFEYVYEPKGPNLYRNGVVELVVDGDVAYGLRLVNRSKHDLYPYLYFFSGTDLSIFSFHPRTDNFWETANIKGAPLKANGGSHTVGYGRLGGLAMAFDLNANQDKDVGFVKLILSTTPIDLSTMPQPTPFEHTRSGRAPGRKPALDTWATKTFTVVQHRHPPKPVEKESPPRYSRFQLPNSPTQGFDYIVSDPNRQANSETRTESPLPQNRWSIGSSSGTRHDEKVNGARVNTDSAHLRQRRH